MAEGYCLKCKKKVEMINATNGTTSRGLRIVKGNCPTCNTKVSRILGK